VHPDTNDRHSANSDDAAALIRYLLLGKLELWIYCGLCELDGRIFWLRRSDVCLE